VRRSVGFTRSNSTSTNRRAHLLSGVCAVAAIVVGVAASTTPVHAQSTASGKALGPAIPTPTIAPPTAPRRVAPTVKPAPRRAPAKKKVVRQTPKVTRKRVVATPKRASVSGIGQGASGPQVLAIQERLAELKYDISNPDGKFGNQTWHAVLAFQKVNNLSRTARVSTKMLELLESATDPTPMVPEGGADRIEIDLKRQYLALYRGGNLDRLVSISSGTGKPYCDYNPDTKKQECDVANTPPGSFRVQSRIAGYRESKLGLLYNPLYFNGGIAIHGSNSVPGYPASHGCVRIPNSTSEWFVTDIPDRIPVYVSDGTSAPKALSGTANPLPQPGGSTVPQASTTAVPTSTTTTTTPGIARVLTTQPGGTPAPPATTVPSTPTAPGTPTTTPSATTPTVLVTPPVGGSTSSTLPGATVATTTTAPVATTTTAATTTTQATIPIIR
jgi:peptidoglycan hydrolase-like protein with peptidoglycan-binding domain